MLRNTACDLTCLERDTSAAAVVVAAAVASLQGPILILLLPKLVHVCSKCRPASGSLQSRPIELAMRSPILWGGPFAASRRPRRVSLARTVSLCIRLDEHDNRDAVLAADVSFVML